MFEEDVLCTCFKCLQDDPNDVLISHWAKRGHDRTQATRGSASATRGLAPATRGQGCDGAQVRRHPAASLRGRGGVTRARGVMGSKSRKGVGTPVPRRGLSSITTAAGPSQPTRRLERRRSSRCKLNLNLPVGDNSPHINALISSSYPSEESMDVDSPMDQSISQGMSLDSYISNAN